MLNFTRKIVQGLRSPKFFGLILALFIAQGILFAFVVSPSTVEQQADGYVTRGGGVVPDGNRHIGAIYYYAAQPLGNGPIINDMSSRDLWIGDLERFPSYLYYYLLGMPVRLALAVGLGDGPIVILIRLIGLGFGVVCLWALRKIALEMKLGQTVASLSALAMAATGAFVWLSPAENYDILGLMFWLLFLLAALRLMIRRDARYLYWMALWFFLVSISKYTYIPFAGLAGLVAYWYYARSIGYIGTWGVIRKQWRNWRKEMTRYQVAGLAVLIVVAGALFTERIGGNLLFYRSFSPSCTQMHTVEDCMNFGVFQRNYTRAAEYERQLATGEAQPIVYNPITYTQFWLDRYYSSMYGYVGHIWIYKFWPLMYTGMTVALVTAAVLAVYVKRRRMKLLATAAEKYILGIVIMLVVAQYVFNLRTFITFGGEMYAYAHQGRYLMSAIGLVYILILSIALRSVRAMSRQQRRVAIPLLIAVGLFVFITNCALVSFFVHADTVDWYSGIGQQIIPAWLLRSN